jgi:VanZ family protein
MSFQLSALSSRSVASGISYELIPVPRPRSPVILFCHLQAGRAQPAPAMCQASTDAGPATSYQPSMSKLSTHPVFIWLPVILVMGIILFMSTLPVDQAGEAIQQVSGPPRDIIRQTSVVPRTFRLDWGKLGHVIGYGVLGLVLYRAVMLTSRCNPRSDSGVGQGSSAVPEHKRPQAAMRVQHSLECCRSARMSGEPSPDLLLPTLIIFGFAILDEFVQYFVPGRSARLSDVILDTTAALLVMVVMKLLTDRWASVR